MSVCELISCVDTAWLRMDRPNNLMQIVGVLMFDGQLDEAILRESLLHTVRVSRAGSGICPSRRERMAIAARPKPSASRWSEADSHSSMMALRAAICCYVREAPLGWQVVGGET